MPERKRFFFFQLTPSLSCQCLIYFQIKLKSFVCINQCMKVSNWWSESYESERAAGDGIEILQRIIDALSLCSSFTEKLFVWCCDAEGVDVESLIWRQPGDPSEVCTSWTAANFPSRLNQTAAKTLPICSCLAQCILVSDVKSKETAKYLETVDPARS